MMKLRLVTPAALVDLGRIPGLGEISANGGLTIGALATHVGGGIPGRDRDRTGDSGDGRKIGDRRCGTAARSAAASRMRDPAADYPTVLKAVGATINAVGKGGERRSRPTTSSSGCSRRRSSREIVTSITPPTTGAAYEKHAHPASRYAVVGVAAVVEVEGGTCKAARITVGGATASPVHATAAAESLIGGSGSEEKIAAAAEKVPESITSAIGDTYASGEYRLHLARAREARADESVRAGRLEGTSGTVPSRTVPNVSRQARPWRRIAAAIAARSEGRRPRRRGHGCDFAKVVGAENARADDRQRLRVGVAGVVEHMDGAAWDEETAGATSVN